MERTAAAFVKQGAILAIASLLVRLMGFVYRIPLTNLIGDTGNAYYSAAYAVYTLVLVVSSGALTTSVSKLVSEHAAKGHYHNAQILFRTATWFSIIIGFIAGLIVWFGAEYFAYILNYPNAKDAIRSLAPAVPIVAVMSVLRGFFQGIHTMIPTAISQIVEQIANVIFSILLAYIFFDPENLHMSAMGATLGTSIAAFAGLIVAFGLYALVRLPVLTRAWEARKTAPWISKKSHLKAILKFFIPVILGLGILSIGNIIDLNMAMSRLIYAGFEEEQAKILVGQFAGKFVLLTSLPIALSVALSQAVMPDISASQTKGETRAVRRKINTAVRVSMAVTIPATVALSVLADPILALIFPNHSEGGQLFIYGAFAIIPMSIVQITTGALQGVGKPSLPIIGTIFGVAAKIPANYVLISIYEINIMGAVISTIICFSIVAIVNIYFVKIATSITPRIISSMIKPAIAATVMGFACYAVNTYTNVIMPERLSTVLAIFAGFIVYFLSMSLIKGFRKEDFISTPFARFFA